MATLARTLDRMWRSINRVLVPRLLAPRCPPTALNPAACYTSDVARIVAGLHERDFEALGSPRRFAA